MEKKIKFRVARNTNVYIADGEIKVNIHIFKMLLKIFTLSATLWRKQILNIVSLLLILKVNICSVLINIYQPAFLVAQTLKDLPAVWETWVRSLVWEDTLEKGMAIHSSILAWRIPQTEEPGRLHTVPWVAKTQAWLSYFHFHFSLYN